MLFQKQQEWAHFNVQALFKRIAVNRLMTTGSSIATEISVPHVFPRTIQIFSSSCTAKAPALSHAFEQHRAIEIKCEPPIHFLIFK